MQCLGYELIWDTPSGTENLHFSCQGCFSRIQVAGLGLSVAQDHVLWRGACQSTQIPEGIKSMGPGSFQWCPVTGQEAPTETQEPPSKC